MPAYFIVQSAITDEAQHQKYRMAIDPIRRLSSKQD